MVLNTHGFKQMDRWIGLASYFYPIQPPHFPGSLNKHTHTHTTSGEGEKDKGIMVRMDNAGVVLAELLHTNLSLRVTKINTEI